jgi:hypothetical protein
MKITILPDNEIRFEQDPLVAIAGLVHYEPEDHDNMDVTDGKTRFKCPPAMRPALGSQIWAVTTNDRGCFWAYELKTVEAFLKQDSNT